MSTGWKTEDGKEIEMGAAPARNSIDFGRIGLEFYQGPKWKMQLAEDVFLASNHRPNIFIRLMQRVLLGIRWKPNR